MSKNKPKPLTTATELQACLAKLGQEARQDQLDGRPRKKLESRIRNSIQSLGQLLVDLDPIKLPRSVFDPGDPRIVGKFISLALVAQPQQLLSSITPFYGSGVYAIYYSGGFPLYSSISASETPIYVGQAAPKVNNARSPIEQGDKLSRRLNEHRKNISKASSTLDISDFRFRALVVQSGWGTAAEDYLIHLFRPVWNSQSGILYGIGKHGDNANTRKNSRSPWDTVHPGRRWAADSTEDAKSIEQIQAELENHFKTHPVFSSLGSLLAAFVQELRQD